MQDWAKRAVMQSQQRLPPTPEDRCPAEPSSTKVRGPGCYSLMLIYYSCKQPLVKGWDLGQEGSLQLGAFLERPDGLVADNFSIVGDVSCQS